MQPIGRGRTAEVYGEGEDRILKWFHPGFSPEAVREEWINSRAAYAAGLPTPEPYGMVEREGRLGIVYGRVNGRTLLVWMMEEPDKVADLAARMAELQHRLHLREGNGLARSMKQALRWGIGSAGRLSEKEKDEAVRVLDGLPDGSSMCHYDFHPDNIMVDGEGRLILLDWMNAVSGHPAGDAARTFLMLRTGTLPEGTPDSVNRLLEKVRAGLTTAYLEHYTKLSGITLPELERWMVPVAAARLSEWLPEQEQELLHNLVRDGLAKV